MLTQVKTKSGSSGALLFSEASAVFWLLYFILTIGVVGFSFIVSSYLPVYILSSAWPSRSPTLQKGAREWMDRVLVFGIHILMEIQPWFSSEIDLDLPDGGKGCLIVSNHRSHLDAFILLSRVKGVRILAKSSLFHVPFLGLMMRLSRQIPAKRGDLESFLRAMDIMHERLAQGESVHVFPELTRCNPGFQGTHPFSTAPFRVAMSGGFKVVPVVFQGTDEVWPREYFGLRFRKKVRVRSLAPLDPARYESSEQLMREARQQIQRELLS